MIEIISEDDDRYGEGDANRDSEIRCLSLGGRLTASMKVHLSEIKWVVTK